MKSSSKQKSKPKKLSAYQQILLNSLILDYGKIKGEKMFKRHMDNIRNPWVA